MVFSRFRTFVINGLFLFRFTLVGIRYVESIHWLKKNPKKIQKKTPLANRAGFVIKSLVELLSGSFGSFERIDFLFGTCFFHGDMRRQIAVPIFPFQWWLGTCCAIPAGWKFLGAVAPITRLNGFMAKPAVVRTALCGHKRALDTVSNCCTNHLNHPPFSLIKKAYHEFLCGQ